MADAAPRIELVFFTGCPHVDAARTALRDALATSGLPLHWTEWNQSDPAAPSRVHGYGSPTVLIAGRDVTGSGREARAYACRADGVASSDTIVTALARAGLQPRSANV